MALFYTITQYVLGLLALVSGAIGFWGETKEDLPRKKGQKSGKKRLTTLGRVSLFAFFASSSLAFLAARLGDRLEESKELARLETERRQHQDTLNSIRATLYPLSNFEIEAYISVKYDEPIGLAGSTDEELAHSLFQHEPGLTDMRVMAIIGNVEATSTGGRYAPFTISSSEIHELLNSPESRFQVVRTDGEWGPVENPSRLWLIEGRVPAVYALNMSAVASLLDLVGQKIQIELMYCFNRREIQGQHELVNVRIIDKRTGLAIDTADLTETDDSNFEGVIPGLADWE